LQAAEQAMKLYSNNEALERYTRALKLLDEIEKATPAIYNLFLTLLDEGFLTDAFGKR
jgi:ATP-dependent Clp protease ATP-binding subunit ClpE